MVKVCSIARSRRTGTAPAEPGLPARGPTLSQLSYMSVMLGHGTALNFSPVAASVKGGWKQLPYLLYSASVDVRRFAPFRFVIFSVSAVVGGLVDVETNG